MENLRFIFNPGRQVGLFHLGNGLYRRRVNYAVFEVLPGIGREQLRYFFQDDGPIPLENLQSRLAAVCNESEVWREIAQWKAEACPCEACTGRRFQIDERRN